MTGLRYMLDTNIVSDFIRNPDGPVARHIRLIGDHGLVVSIVVASELRHGAARRGSARLIERVEETLARIRPVPLDVPADTTYALVRSRLEAAGTPVGPNDLFIAAHALALDATLVTANEREFRRIAGLRVENWLV